MSKWVQGRVVGNKRWTEQLFTLRVAAPVEPFQAGQFTRLALDIDGERVARAYSYVNAPGLVESFEKSGLSHEAYLTGQCAAVFVKMMVEDVFMEKGLFVPEQLSNDAREYCFQELAELDVTVDALSESPVA